MRSRPRPSAALSASQATASALSDTRKARSVPGTPAWQRGRKAIQHHKIRRLPPADFCEFYHHPLLILADHLSFVVIGLLWIASSARFLKMRKIALSIRMILSLLR